MRHCHLVCLFVFLQLLVFGHLTAQTIAELEARLQATSTPAEQGDLEFKLAKNWFADNLDSADAHAQKALALAVSTHNKSREAEVALFRGSIKRRQERYREAIASYTRAWETASAGIPPEAALQPALQAAEQLQELTALQGDYKAAYTWGRRQAELQQQSTRSHADEQLRQQQAIQAELTAQKKQATYTWSAILASLILFMSVLYFTRQRSNRRMRGELAEKNAMLEDRRRRGEQLLLNILPKAVANELTIQNRVAARRYEHTTVMFVDFVNFTHAAERFEPEMLVKELDHCFSRFDTLIARYRIEKIKTVGDAYICASGLSDGNESPADMIRAAMDIQDFLHKLKAERGATGREYFEARIGIHFGPVVAGVVGVKKFAYDIWGDTVNTAARLEEACAPGRVNVSGAAQALVQNEFQWEHRGKIAAKNKAALEMYYVIG